MARLHNALFIVALIVGVGGVGLHGRQLKEAVAEVRRRPDNFFGGGVGVPFVDPRGIDWRWGFGGVPALGGFPEQPGGNYAGGSPP